MSKLKNQVAVVTGASKGIGAGIAKALAGEGAAVVVNYSSSKEGADKVVAEITATGGKAVAVQADVELGGTDQKFNLLMGREFQLNYKQEQQVVMMMPLLEGLDGVRKMSKSYSNYVAFNDPPKEMFGKLMSVPDALMTKYFELLTDIDLESIKSLHPRDAKVLLGKTIVTQFHGAAAGDAAAAEFDRVFSKKQAPEDVPEHQASKSPIGLIDLLVEAGLAPSKKEARRLLEQGAVEADGKRVGEKDSLTLSAPVLLQVGKRRFVKILSR